MVKIKYFYNEVFVSSVTTLDNKCGLPFATGYVSKRGKTGDDMNSSRSIQICKKCLKTMRTDNHIIEFHEINMYVVIAFKSKMLAKNVRMMDKFLSEYVGDI